MGVPYEPNLVASYRERAISAQLDAAGRAEKAREPGGDQPMRQREAALAAGAARGYLAIVLVMSR
jgi:hypothetical protein